jgi:hypothetical protein
VELGAKYQGLEKEAQEKFGLSPDKSKPLIARYVADTIPIDAASNAEKKLREFAKAIEALT